MNKTLKVVLVIFVALFLLSGALRLIGSIFSLTFSLVLGLIHRLWGVLFHPVVLVAIILLLAWKLNKKS